MDFIIETDRLFLKKLDIEDFRFVITLLNSPGWLQYIGDRKVKNEEQAINYLQTGPLKSYADHGFGLYKVEEKISCLPVGFCGLLKRDTLNHPDLGFAFLPEFIGKGFGHEAAHAIVEFAKTGLGIAVLQAIALPDNMPSIRLLKKLGFHYQRPFRFLEGNELTLFELHL
ncbi:GNAT family N-acetyltransferase [Aquiflexum sp. LQ15W]|uniref:GNAT family N-acetyltransferase n=1 Tax=Cognataquiflexum nitidum TaxID=2922272 RepID=UPI001F145BE2|nr:GNAT family N-acetyltransferase [Cognataquiflexum nitidum]MCH6199469.1 GNAT family N-acetyltransferase [Cognataquiflexum nitidum]